MIKKIFLACTITMTLTANAQLKSVSYSDGDQKLNGFAIAPSAKSKNAGVLILPAWKGIDEHSKKVAQDLSALGYHAFIADIYGEGNYPANSKEAGEKSGFFKKNYKNYNVRILLALEELVKAGADAGNIAIIGYCFGGTGAIEAAQANMPVRGIVSFHGGLGKDETRSSSDKIVPKVLILHGADDPYVPQKDILAFQDEMRKAKADWQMIYYADAVHAFTEISAGTDNSKGAAYNEVADRRSWEHMKLFLQEILR